MLDGMTGDAYMDELIAIGPATVASSHCFSQTGGMESQELSDDEDEEVLVEEQEEDEDEGLAAGKIRGRMSPLGRPNLASNGPPKRTSVWPKHGRS